MNTDTPSPETSIALTDKATAYLNQMLRAGYKLTVEYDPHCNVVTIAFFNSVPVLPNQVGDTQFGEIRCGGETFADAINQLGDPDYHNVWSEQLDQALDDLYAKQTQAQSQQHDIHDRSSAATVQN